MKCSRCQSNNVSRNGRTFWERCVRARSYRCRDCKHRFRVGGFEWGGIILGSLAVVVAASLVAAVMFVNNRPKQETPADAPKSRPIQVFSAERLPTVSTIPTTIPEDPPAQSAKYSSSSQNH